MTDKVQPTKQQREQILIQGFKEGGKLADRLSENLSDADREKVYDDLWNVLCQLMWNFDHLLDLTEP